jgi:hypothetical protein
MAYPIAGLKNVNGNSRLVLGNAIERSPPANSRQRPVRHLSLVEAESPAQKSAVTAIGGKSAPRRRADISDRLHRLRMFEPVADTGRAVIDF